MTIEFNGKKYSKQKLVLQAHMGHFEDVNPDEVICMGNSHETIVGYKHDGKMHLLLGDLKMLKEAKYRIRVLTKHALKKADITAMWVDPQKEVKAAPRPPQRKFTQQRYR